MSGFTLYETLRIFVPGAIALFVADLVARLAFGPSSLAADGAAAPFVEALESPAVAITGAILVGLLLYALDLPAKTRIYSEGEPANGLRVPTRTLETHLAPTELASNRRAFRIYFLLSDQYLPVETHKRAGLPLRLPVPNLH